MKNNQTYWGNPEHPLGSAGEPSPLYANPGALPDHMPWAKPPMAPVATPGVPPGFFNQPPGLLGALGVPPSAGKAEPKMLPEAIMRILDTPLSVFQEMSGEKPQPGAKPVTHVGFVLDKSSSMANGKSATIEGFNTQMDMVKQGAEGAGDTRITLVDFANLAQTRYVAQSPGSMEALSEQNYIPSGMTALYDAIGLLLTELLTQPEIEAQSTATLVTIFTDGEENQSQRYTAHILKDVIQKLEATGRWTFALVGPKNGVNALADLLAVDRSNITGFNPDSVAERVEVMGAMANASSTYMRGRASGETQVYGLYSPEVTPAH